MFFTYKQILKFKTLILKGKKALNDKSRVGDRSVSVINNDVSLDRSRGVDMP